MKSNTRTSWMWYSLAGLVLLAVWLTFEPYPSHFISGLRILGDTTTQTLWGVAKEGRGDEWSTYLPMLKQAALEGFPAQSALEPYREKLNWFIAIPKADLSLFFLPNYLAYWIVSPGKALSFQAFFYYSVLIGSIIWYLQNLRVNPALAVIAAVSVVFSQLYQVWWTSNFPALAVCFLPFAVLTSKISPFQKALLLFWVVGHMAFGQMYPPTYFAVAVALVPLTFAIRPDLLNVRTLLYATVAAGAALAVYWFWNSDFISAVSGTSYPGRRFSTGGGSSWMALISTILPTFPVAPVAGGDALYELSMAGTLFPLMLLALLPYVTWDREAIRLTVVAGLMLGVLVFYSIIGFSPALAKWTGFFVMPGRRSHPGISFIVLVYAVIMISRNWGQWKPLAITLVLGLFAVVSAYVGVRPEATGEFWGISLYAYLPLALLAVALVIYQFRPHELKFGPAAGFTVLAGMAVAHVLIFGSFNPVMRGSDIMDPVRSQFVNDWKALYKKNDGKPFAVAGNYGHLLRGEGLAALEAIHMVNVDPDSYRRVFPELSDEQIRNYFNRFLGIAFDNFSNLDPKSITMVFPLRPHAVSFAHQVVFKTSDITGLLAHPPRVSQPEFSGAGYRVRWSGWMNIPLPIDRTLKLALPCDVGHSWLTRSPSPVGAEVAADGVSLRVLSGEFTVLSESSEKARQCVQALTVE
ncbi:DUF7657 domain-containing protein [Achromobacter spanius]|uniref:DUF7657 domain-containing protein n=1 Tax=Achromobacter spanius TaxID=217203 RepID=A0AA42LND2_9BURK|nr:hypothetical protein [Achromobacter spanius]MDH0735237.1 hypothetical protein [Achromobacter spanius]